MSGGTGLGCGGAGRPGAMIATGGVCAAGGLLLYALLHLCLITKAYRLIRERSLYAPAFAASYMLFFCVSLTSHLILYPTYFIFLTAFWGTIGTQTVMPFGKPEDVKRTVKEMIDLFAPGLLVAPTHVLEPEVPWENILALVDAVEEYGDYSQFR